MDDLRNRVAALERAIADGEGDATVLGETAAPTDRVADLESEIDRLREEVDELAAATQALRGYVGNVRSVNESVEERAEAAAAAVESLEARVERLEAAGSDRAPGVADRMRSEPPDPDTATDSHTMRGDGSDGAATAPLDADPERRVDRPGNGVPAATVGGFDPDAAGDRVRVSHDGGTDSHPATDRESGDDGVDDHLLDRVRDLL